MKKNKRRKKKQKKKKSHLASSAASGGASLLFLFLFLSFKVWLNPKDCKGDSRKKKKPKKKKKNPKKKRGQSCPYCSGPLLAHYLHSVFVVLFQTQTHFSPLLTFIFDP
jgi:hypothetical protein